MDDLYRETIIEHYKNPGYRGKLDPHDISFADNNPLCGDHVTVYLKLDNGVIQDIAFQGSGCAISKASASMMTQAVKGKTKAEAEILFNEFHRMAMGELDEETEPNHLGKLTIFAGVREFPARVKCATLSWHTMHAALEGQDVATTE